MLKRVLVTDGMDASAVAKLRADGCEVVEQFYEPGALGPALRGFGPASLPGLGDCAPALPSGPLAAFGYLFGG